MSIANCSLKGLASQPQLPSLGVNSVLMVMIQNDKDSAGDKAARPYIFSITSLA